MVGVFTAAPTLGVAIVYFVFRDVYLVEVKGFSLFSEEAMRARFPRVEDNGEKEDTL
jgi:hypothetical protein